MACGTYPIDPVFQATMREEARAIVRQLRQHPAIILWSGDNECDMLTQYRGFGQDPNRNHITRQVLPDVLYAEDPTRPYLPSSPYLDEQSWRVPQRYLTENHLWGPRDYFKGPFYRRPLSHFVSEIGYHGCPHLSSMRRFLAPEDLWPWQGNRAWRLHASAPDPSEGATYTGRIDLMARQTRELFGAIPETVEAFVLASQISQAEAKKYFIELFRSEQARRSGIIWWNLIDGWPQFSDAVVDYFFAKKLAYHYIRSSQQPLLVMLREPENWGQALVAVNQTGVGLDLRYRVTDSESGELICEGEARCADARTTTLAEIDYSQDLKRVYVIEWEAGEWSGRNHYLAGNPPFELEWYRSQLEGLYPEAFAAFSEA